MNTPRTTTPRAIPSSATTSPASTSRATTARTTGLDASRRTTSLRTAPDARPSRNRYLSTAPAAAVLAVAATLGGSLTACAAVRSPAVATPAVAATVSTTAPAAAVADRAAGALAATPGRLGPGVACRPALPVVRPTHVPISCGDGSAYAIHVRWTQLSASRGHAVGVVLLDDCIPNCAAGRYHAYAARLDFTRVRMSAHRPAFTRLAITFSTRHPAGHPVLAAAY